MIPLVRWYLSKGLNEVRCASHVAIQKRKVRGKMQRGWRGAEAVADCRSLEGYYTVWWDDVGNSLRWVLAETCTLWWEAWCYPLWEALQWFALLREAPWTDLHFKTITLAPVQRIVCSLRRVEGRGSGRELLKWLDSRWEMSKILSFSLKHLICNKFITNFISLQLYE